eukprot:05155_6
MQTAPLRTAWIAFNSMFCSIAARSALYTPPGRDGSDGNPASDADSSRCGSSFRESFPKIVSPYIEVTVFTFDIANSCSRRALVFPKFWGLAPAAWMACTPREYFNPPLSSESPNTTPAVTKYSPLPRRFPSLEDVTPFSDVTEKGDATFIKKKLDGLGVSTVFGLLLV